MNQITLEAIDARQTELVDMIAKFKRQAATTTVVYREVYVELQSGERYAGAVLDANGIVSHHLVLMAEKPDGKLNWKDALAWAERIGGALPNRQEAALLFANCKPHLDAEWHWTSESYEPNESYAWICYFGNGIQSYGRKGSSLCARAVRRLNA